MWENQCRLTCVLVECVWLPGYTSISEALRRASSRASANKTKQTLLSEIVSQKHPHSATAKDNECFRGNSISAECEFHLQGTSPGELCWSWMLCHLKSHCRDQIPNNNSSWCSLPYVSFPLSCRTQAGPFCRKLGDERPSSNPVLLPGS